MDKIKVLIEVRGASNEVLRTLEGHLTSIPRLGEYLVISDTKRSGHRPTYVVRGVTNVAFTASDAPDLVFDHQVIISVGP